jgi:hypothetical protein
MTNYLQTKIREIGDPEFQSLISETCQGRGWPPESFADRPLSFLLMVIGKEKKKLTLQHVAPSQILAKKVRELAHGSVVHDVCLELTTLNGTINEAFYDNSVLTLMMRCYKVFCPKPYRQRKPSKSHLKYQQTIDLIKRSRETRDIWG